MPHRHVFAAIVLLSVLAARGLAEDRYYGNGRPLPPGVEAQALDARTLEQWIRAAQKSRTLGNRLDAIKALEGIAQHIIGSPAEEKKALADALLSCAKNDESPRIRKSAIEALYPPAGDHSTYTHVAGANGGFYSATLIESTHFAPLSDILKKDADDDVRTRAAVALGYLGDEAIPPLKVLILSKDKLTKSRDIGIRHDLKAACIDAIGQIGTPLGAETLNAMRPKVDDKHQSRIDKMLDWIDSREP